MNEILKRKIKDGAIPKNKDDIEYFPYTAMMLSCPISFQHESDSQLIKCVEPKDRRQEYSE